MASSSRTTPPDSYYTTGLGIRTMASPGSTYSSVGPLSCKYYSLNPTDGPDQNRPQDQLQPAAGNTRPSCLRTAGRTRRTPSPRRTLQVQAPPTRNITRTDTRRCRPRRSTCTPTVVDTPISICLVAGPRCSIRRTEEGW